MPHGLLGTAHMCIWVVVGGCFRGMAACISENLFQKFGIGNMLSLNKNFNIIAPYLKSHSIAPAILGWQLWTQDPGILPRCYLMS